MGRSRRVDSLDEEISAETILSFPKVLQTNRTLNFDDSLSSFNCENHGTDPIQTTNDHSESGLSIDSQAKGKVTYLRIVVAICLVFMAVFVPLLTYLVTRKAEVHAFENRFHSLADEVINKFEWNMASTLFAIDSISVATTSCALQNHLVWPFVTVPDFEALSKNAAYLASTLSIGLNVIVSPELRNKWEEYTVKNIGWLWAASSNSVGNNRRMLEPPNVTLGFSEQIYRFDKNVPGGKVVDTSPGPYVPIWQYYPLNPQTVNFNIADEDEADGRAVKAVMNTSRIVISQVELLGNQNVDDYSDFLDAYVNDTYVHEGEPITNLYYPIFDTFEVGRRVVGIYSASIFWHTYFRGLLPLHANGIVCVVENACGDEFTYIINGGEPCFVGIGDLHSEVYDHLQVTYDFASVKNASKFRYSDTAPALDIGFCPYTLRVYPSKDLEDASVTFVPFAYAGAVAFVIIIVVAIMASYEWVTQRRMKRITATEKQARGLVAVHFPENVRGRMMAEGKATVHALNNHTRTQLKSFLQSGRKNDQERNQDVTLNEKPIADLSMADKHLGCQKASLSSHGVSRPVLLSENIIQKIHRYAVFVL